MNEYKVPKSGGESINLYEIENRKRSQEPQPEDKGTDRRFLFSAVYNYIAVDVFTSSRTFI